MAGSAVGSPGGSREADFTSYVAARQQALLRTAYVLTGDRHSAEDLLQQALAKAYLSWHRLRDPGAADGYVRKIMVNEHTGWWRRAWRRNERSTEELPEPRSGSPADSTGRCDERDAMWSLLQSLPPRQRAAVVLRYYEDLSEAETAAVLGCSVGTVKSQTSRAIAALRQRLATETTTGQVR
ncbi:MAG: SigE family RNA polymerase sigma factor [Actinomycetota bacterium]|nr:SigE family RNA polymerase sigma factor [Actinomycetota bacterium]